MRRRTPDSCVRGSSSGTVQGRHREAGNPEESELPVTERNGTSAAVAERSGSSTAVAAQRGNARDGGSGDVIVDELETNIKTRCIGSISILLKRKD